MDKNDFFQRHYVKITALLLLIYSFQVIYAITTYSVTYDEPSHINDGYEYLKTGIHPRPESLNTILLSLNALPFLQHGHIPHNSNETNNSSLLRTLLFRARTITLVYGIMLGIVIFLWARELFGIHSGLLALFLYSFEPNIIAHSSVVTSDMLATSCIFVAAYSFYKFTKNPTFAWCTTGGLLLGIALTAKLTALLLIPIYVILIISIKKNRTKKHFGLLFILFFISLLFLNTAYLFHGTLTSPSIYAPSELFSDKIFSAIKNIPLPLPSEYVLALQYSREYNHPFIFYLFGSYSREGWWNYFISAFAIKTQLPLLILILCSMMLLFRSQLKDAQHLLLPIITILIFMSYFGRHNNIGLRFILPIYPFLITLASSFATIKKMRWFICLLIIWSFISTIMVAPHYLAYFNEFAGGPAQGYRYLADSNIDWGQADIIAQQYVNQSNTSIILNPGCTYTPGRIATSVNNLHDIFNETTCHSWLRELTPVDNLGYAYLIYDVPEKEEKNEQ